MQGADEGASPAAEAEEEVPYILVYLKVRLQEIGSTSAKAALQDCLLDVRPQMLASA